MIDNQSARSNPLMNERKTHADYIEARLKSIQKTMITKSNFGPTLLLANLVSFGLMAAIIVLLNAIGALG